MTSKGWTHAKDSHNRAGKAIRHSLSAKGIKNKPVTMLHKTMDTKKLNEQFMQQFKADVKKTEEQRLKAQEELKKEQDALEKAEEISGRSEEVPVFEDALTARGLAVYKIGGNYYYRDERLGEYRNVNNPGHTMLIEDVPTSRLERPTIQDSLRVFGEEANKNIGKKWKVK